MVFKIQNIQSHLYFVTAKIEDGKYLFKNPEYASIILESLDWLRRNHRIQLFAFVIMPNHIHYVMLPKNDYLVSQICHQFESFTAHKILKKLRANKNIELLNFFKSRAEELKDRKHKIWCDLQAKNIHSADFLLQKVEYIHNNPINIGWELVKDRIDYCYSSACFYDRDIKPIIEVDDLRKIL